ncbi:hypothetical protein [Methylocystis echinoides]|uniref:hypothetical protein n=1 Tax=Methylocystis echinoides TaxID=29468 RepID=UPI00342ABB93
MQKYLGVFVIGGIVGFACATTFSPKVVVSQNPVQAAPALTIAVDDPPNEHVRHMRVHKTPTEIEEAPKASQASAADEQAKLSVDETPTGLIKHSKPRKVKLASNKKRKIEGEQEAATGQAPPAEIESPPPRGFFETLFQGNFTNPR